MIEILKGSNTNGHPLSSSSYSSSSSSSSLVISKPYRLAGERNNLKLTKSNSSNSDRSITTSTSASASASTSTSSSLSFHSTLISQPKTLSSSPSSSSSINSSTKRSQAINELIQTESTYSNDLRLINHIYLRRAYLLSSEISNRGNHNPKKSVGLDQADLKTIFLNIDQLYRFSTRLIDDLKSSADNNSLGSCFIDHLPEIENLFKVYCFGYESSQKRLNQIFQSIKLSSASASSTPTPAPTTAVKNPTSPPTSPVSLSSSSAYSTSSSSVSSSLPKPLGNPSSPNKKASKSSSSSSSAQQERTARLIQYFQSCQSALVGQTNAWDLPSLLIKPVQRVMKYSLLLEQIIKFTEPDDEDLPQLIRAKEGMDRVAESINESKRRQELIDSIIRERKKIKNRLRPSLPTTISITTVTGIEPFDRLRISLNSLRRLPNALRLSVNEITNFMIAGDQLSQSFKKVYLLNHYSNVADNEKDYRRRMRTGHDGDSDDGEVEDAVRGLTKFQELVIRAGLRGPIKYLNDQLSQDIIPKIQALIKLYENPIKLISVIVSRSKSSKEAEAEILRIEEIKKFEELRLRIVERLMMKFLKIRREVSFDMMVLIRRTIETSNFFSERKGLYSHSKSDDELVIVDRPISVRGGKLIRISMDEQRLILKQEQQLKRRRTNGIFLNSNSDSNFNEEEEEEEEEDEEEDEAGNQSNEKGDCYVEEEGDSLKAE